MFTVLLLIITLLSMSADGCSNGDIRLYGGSTDSEGMVQMCNNSTGNASWEAVCDYYWSCYESVIACRQLGYSNAVPTYSTNYGPWTSVGFGPYSCSYPSSSYTSLEQCSKYSYHIGTYRCLSQRDTVYLDCTFMQGTCTDGNVRLVNGTTSNEGRVEYCDGGSWTALLTRYSFSQRTAYLICRQLGFVANSYGRIIRDGSFGRGASRVTVSYISCDSYDATLDDCYIDKQLCYYTYYTSYNHYGLRCYDPECSNEGEIRLADGTVENEGRVETCTNGVWSSICDYGFDTTDGHVICSELGLTHGAIVYYNSVLGSGYGPIVYVYVACEGHEDSFTECYKRTLLEYYWLSCNTDTVGVLCVDGCKEGDVRIRDGKPYGTVEVCIDEIWGLIIDHGWSYNDTTVVCRQLGYGPHGVAVGNSTYGKPRRAIHFSNVYCTGNEDSILDCSYHQYLLDDGKALTDHAEVYVVGVSCSHDIMTTVSGSNTFSNIGLASNTPGSRTRPVDEPESVDMLPSHDQLTTLVIACLALLITIVIALCAILMTVVVLKRRPRRQDPPEQLVAETNPTYEELELPLPAAPMKAKQLFTK